MIIWKKIIISRGLKHKAAMCVRRSTRISVKSLHAPRARQPRGGKSLSEIKFFAHAHRSHPPPAPSAIVSGSVVDGFRCLPRHPVACAHLGSSCAGAYQI